MRWDKHKGYKYGDKKIVKRFLLFPRCLDNDCRWLEIAYIVKKYIISDDDCPGWWIPLRWASKEQYIFNKRMKKIFTNSPFAPRRSGKLVKDE